MHKIQRKMRRLTVKLIVHLKKDIWEANITFKNKLNNN